MNDYITLRGARLIVVIKEMSPANFKRSSGKPFSQKIYNARRKTETLDEAEYITLVFSIHTLRQGRMMSQFLKFSRKSVQLFDA